MAFVARIWDFNEPISAGNWKNKVFGYLLKPGVNEKLVATYDDVKGFLKEFEALYRKQYPKTPALDLDRLWTTFMRDLTTKMKVWTKRWLLYRADEMAKDWAAAAILSYAQEALTILEKAQEHQKKHGIAVDKFKPDVVFK
ncbi:hypothetical protein IWW34DRAFT_881042 [Fusarium oxysporum f. sp. albedinis]|uniref:uncharacterized protein n=1 Tax=Fusarium oxysporum Fo47 TaxID=660027 RepID=UPI002869EB86|nr:uncharacterized protein FOBCDRAFT_208823 [Fusarium oxysporum Fo47]KAI3576613.1 hypothetical protein IWW34DRAFT_881042 [Fusarium oxysporum f. sp. albedinis]KAK2473460.1 hypothetical protein H9L39_15635 [Fusarium oxysporum f. sp. albedinis]QKD62154.2 hypothetical protein FOBCDRAFT_208823 [Fusarium oxysporum Fo47]